MIRGTGPTLLVSKLVKLWLPFLIRTLFVAADVGAEHAVANLHIELGRGITGLRTVACTAPLLGIFGTGVLLRSALHSAAGCGYGDCAGGVAETFFPLALSLLVSVLASGGMHYLRRQIEGLGLDMHVGILNLLDHLSCRPAGC